MWDERDDGLPVRIGDEARASSDDQPKWPWVPTAVVWMPGMSMDDVERRVIGAALAVYQGNVSLAAHSLGMARRRVMNMWRSIKMRRRA